MWEQIDHISIMTERVNQRPRAINILLLWSKHRGSLAELQALRSRSHTSCARERDLKQIHGSAHKIGSL
jgi:hypothetical protein